MGVPRKGVTPIIAIIVLLLITVALAGVAWTYTSTYFAGLVSQHVEVVDSFYTEDGRGMIVLRNTGTSAIDISDISVIEIETGNYVTDAVEWVITGGGTGISPGETMTARISCSGSCEYAILTGAGDRQRVRLICGSKGTCQTSTTPCVEDCTGLECGPGPVCGQSCGNCGNGEACQAGACECLPNRGDCNGLPGDGCEVDHLTDDQYCGDCFTSCTAPETCVSGSCKTTGCAPGTADCDPVPDGICETDIYTDENNCGGCGAACSTSGGIASCAAGSCSIVCTAPGMDDCSADENVSRDGCETDVTTATNCGGCGITCGVGQDCINGQCLDVAWMASMVSWWWFDGNVQDSRGNHDGTIPGSPNSPTYTTSGRFGGAYHFDGYDDYINVGVINVQNNFTLAGWFYLEGLPYYGGEYVDPRIIIKGGEVAWQAWGIIVERSIWPEFRIGEAGKQYVTSVYGEAGSVPFNEWHHIAGVYNGSYMVLYYDGMEVDNLSLTTTIVQSSNETWIGGQCPYPLKRPWNGTLDEIMVFNGSLTAQQVLELYNRDLDDYKT